MRKDTDVYVVAWDELIGPALNDTIVRIMLGYGYFNDEYECECLCDQLSQQSQDSIKYYPYALQYRSDIFTQSRVVPFCHKCAHGIKQRDLFDTRVTYLEGCTLMPKDKYDNYEQRVKHCVCCKQEKSNDI